MERELKYGRIDGSLTPHPTYRVQSPRIFLDGGAIVADLIDKDTRW
jgi:hypothetical protein